MDFTYLQGIRRANRALVENWFLLYYYYYDNRASDYPREYGGGCLQMRLSYSPCAHIFLFLVQWTDCHLAGALGLLRILIYKV